MAPLHNFSFSELTLRQDNSTKDNAIKVQATLKIGSGEELENESEIKLVDPLAKSLFLKEGKAICYEASICRITPRSAQIVLTKAKFLVSEGKLKDKSVKSRVSKVKTRLNSDHANFARKAMFGHSDNFDPRKNIPSNDKALENLSISFDTECDNELEDAMIEMEETGTDPLDNGTYKKDIVKMLRSALITSLRMLENLKEIRTRNETATQAPQGPQETGPPDKKQKIA